MHHAVVANVEHLRPYMPWIAKEPVDLHERRSMIERWASEWADGGDVTFGVWAGDELVGSAGLHRRLGPGGLEIGYWVHVDHLGRGYATEAARLLTDLAFTVPDIDRVEIHHDVTNLASGRVPAKLGFERIGEITPGREEVAPSETGVDVVWRTTRPRWTTAEAST
jgi:RimJ/RimL family protein N-acetyltransferase